MGHWRALLAAALLLGAGSAHADLDLDRLQALVEAGRMGAAYELAVEHRPEYEGNIRFDFYFGVAAIDSGQLSEGVFALERVLMRRPDLDRARLELARAYFLLGDLQRAERAFLTVRAHDPPDSVRATIDDYLDRIRLRADDYRTTVSGYAGVGAGHDTNVNSAPDAELVETPFGVIPLSAAGREIADDFARATAGVKLSHPLAPGLNLFGGIDVDARRLSEETDFETTQLAVRGGLRRRANGADWRIGVDAAALELAGEPYRDIAGLSGRYRWQPSPVLSARTDLRVSTVAYETQPILDSSTWHLGAGVSRAWRTPAQPSVSGGVHVGQELADTDSDAARAVAERDFAGVSAGFRVGLAARLRLKTQAELQRSEYAAEHGIFLETREEDYGAASAALEWRPGIHWTVRAELRYSENDSNVDLYDYERTLGELGVRYDFF